MHARKGSDPPLAVVMPAGDGDRPSWIKVGVIAAVGFVVGVGWPRVMGVRLGPSAPGEASAAASAARAGEPSNTMATAVASVGPTSIPGPVAPPASVAVPVAPPSVTVGRGIVLTCRTEDGEALKGVSACGSLAGFDAVARPRLGKLASCAAAMGANGKLSTVFNLDFKGNRIGVDVGKSSTVGNTDAFGTCLRSGFQGVSLGPIGHDQAKYAVAYSVMFGTKEGGAGSTATATATSTSTATATATATHGASPSNEEGTAQVVWEVALVRDTPRTGQVVARLPRGTKLHLGAGEEGWYRVHFGSDFTSEGWVHRGAIGK